MEVLVNTATRERSCKRSFANIPQMTTFLKTYPSNDVSTIVAPASSSSNLDRIRA